MSIAYFIVEGCAPRKNDHQQSDQPACCTRHTGGKILGPKPSEKLVGQESRGVKRAYILGTTDLIVQNRVNSIKLPL
jgi:hypothetical protein